MLLCALLLAACATGKEFNMVRMGQQLDVQPFAYATTRTVEEIDALFPQGRFRLNVAVWFCDKAWTFEEMEVIRSWETPPKEAGLVDKFVILPGSMQEHHYIGPLSRLAATRQTAARNCPHNGAHARRGALRDEGTGMGGYVPAAGPPRSAWRP